MSADSESVLRVVVLVFSGSSMMSVACAVDPLRAANKVVGNAVFDWSLVSLDGKPPTTTADIALPVSGKLGSTETADLLVIVAGFGANEMTDRKLLAAIYRAAVRARMVCGIEAGAWLLARAGLLDGRSATTHWEDLADFEMAFPAVNVRPDRYVVDGRFITTGGASPTFDMMIDLIRERLGPIVAIDVASAFIYDGPRDAADAQHFVSLGQADRYDPRLIQAVRIMESRLDKPVTIAAIAKRVGISSRTLETIFLRELGESPGAYFLALRLSAARRLVGNTRVPFAEVAERTGFSSAATFSRAFRNAYGDNPSSFRRDGRPHTPGR